MAYKLAVRGEFHTVMRVHSNPSLSALLVIMLIMHPVFLCSCLAQNPSQIMSECNKLTFPDDSHCRYLNAKPAQTMSKAVSYKLTVLYCLVQEALMKKAELDRQKHVLLEKQVAQQKVRIAA